MKFVCTVLAKGQLPKDKIERVAEFVKQKGVTNAEIVKLAEHATDITFESPVDAVTKSDIYQLSEQLAIDIILQPLEHRQKKLVIFDMDSTLIQQEVIEMIAARANVEPQVAEITTRAMNGELDFNESLKERAALLKGIPSSVFEDLKKEISFSKGAVKLCHTLHDQGVKMAVLSGGFIQLASWVKEQLKLDYAFANTLAEQDGKLTGETSGRIVNGDVKAQLLKEIAAKENIELIDAVAVGDGSNDLKMMATGGFGIAFNAKPMVQQKAPSRFNTGDLSDILYILGR